MSGVGAGARLGRVARTAEGRAKLNYNSTAAVRTLLSLGFSLRAGWRWGKRGAGGVEREREREREREGEREREREKESWWNRELME